MSTTPEGLLAEARAVAEHAYAPYSRFRVGAVVVDEQGNLYRGVNVENAAYPSGVCAEAGAISAAATAGVRKLSTVAVACLDAHELVEAYPCGQCRQRLNEFGVETVIVGGPNGRPRVHTLTELLPYGFKMDAR